MAFKGTSISKSLLFKDNDKPHNLTKDLDELYSSIKLDFEVQSDISKFEKALHDQRLQNMRKIADKLKDDSWKYSTIEKLLGLN